MHFSLNQKLALTAFSLSLLAMITSLIIPEPSDVQTPEYISVLNLAHEIKNRNNITVIDLRSKQEFEEFHIPSARHIPLSILADLEFPYDERIVFYSGDDSLSIQAWNKSKKSGYDNITVLRGGVHDWYERVLYPAIPLQVPPGQTELADEIKELSAFFGGRPQYVEDHHVLGYYNRVGEITAPKRTRSLVRMGC